MVTSTQHPSPEQVRQALERVTSDQGFVRSRRMCSLLAYLVEESLAGQGDKIKATSIAIDVFGRDSSFDQQSDPIVRVEAGRLRNRLAEYYNGNGRIDPVHIEIPKGAYIPHFTLRTLESTATQPNSSVFRWLSSGQRRNILLAFVAGVLVTSLAALIVRQDSSDTGSTPYSGPRDTRPYIVVSPVAATSGDAHSESLAAGLAEALITNLSKISGLSVMAHASVLESHQRGEPLGIAEFRSQFGVTHLFRGTIERDGDRVVINMQLVDARTARVLWAERASRALSNIIELEEELAINIAQRLAVELRPGERERLSQAHSASSDAWLFYRQGLVTIMPPNDLVRVQAARQLFDRASQVDPSFAGGLAGHSFAHSTRVLFMNTTDPAWELANAKAMATKAITLDPDFSAGYAMMAFAQILAGEREQALASAQQSVDIQPGDAFARFIIGMSLIISDQPGSSIPHLQEALRLDPLESRMPYLNVLGIAYFVAEDYGNSLGTFQHNYERGGPKGPHMEVFIAASHAQLGNLEQASASIDNLKEKYPDFPARRWLTRWVIDSNKQQQLLELLEELGLDE
jgi:TolB-like protein/Tfp pilus assembly protein PilF